MYSDPEGKSQHIFTWRIENFRACTQKNGISLSSPVFLAESLEKTTWFVELYPRGECEASKELISCFLSRDIDSAGPDNVECGCTIEAIDSKNRSLKKLYFLKIFQRGGDFGFRQFLKRDEKLDNETLIIRVTLINTRQKIYSRNSCLTKVLTDSLSLKWDVKNSTTSDADIKTVYFSENLIFQIALKIPKDDVEISIRRTKGFEESEILMCSVFLLDLKGQEADSKEVLFKVDEPHLLNTWKFPNFLKISKLTEENDKYLEEDYFTLKFDFALSSGKKIESVTDIECKSLDNFLKAQEEHSSSLKADLKRMLSNHAFSDVELHAGKEIIRAHKVILCARSPIFSAMFNQDMIEKQKSVIVISDIETETLNHFLEYLYTGDTGSLSYESCVKLLLAADKYQVLSLKEKCSSSLESMVSDENVCEILFTADLIQQQSLKLCTVNYIKENFKTIFKSTEWKQLAEKNLHLATETACEVSSFLSV